MQLVMDYLNAQSNIVDLRVSETKRGIEYLESQAEEPIKRADIGQEESKLLMHKSQYLWCRRWKTNPSRLGDCGGQ
jgi:hypothetical protein